MSTKTLTEQLKKVEYADLSQYDAEKGIYFIPKRVDIKIEEDHCYLINIKDSFFSNMTIKNNWNNGSIPANKFLKIDVSKVMGKMIKVVGVGYDPLSKTDLGQFWNGWLTVEDIQVLEIIA